MVWNPDGRRGGWDMQRLSAPNGPLAAGFPYTEPLAINNLGEIVGDVWGSSAGAPALWKPDRTGRANWTLTVLSSLNTTPMWDLAWGINDLGDIVGYCYDANWVQHATRWNAHTPLNAVQLLGFPGSWSAAYSVNNLGIAVGGYGVGDVERAYAVQIR